MVDKWHKKGWKTRQSRVTKSTMEDLIFAMRATY